MEENQNTIKIPFKTWAIWATLLIVPLIFYPHVLRSSWVSNSDIHSLLEFWAAAMSLVVAGIVLVHFFATGSRFFLFIALGFILQGTEELVHAFYAFDRIWIAKQAGMINFVPGIYVAGRFVLILCIFLALGVKDSASIVKEKRKRYTTLYNSLGFMTAAVATVIIIKSPLPQFILSEQVISRPVDLVVAIMYLVAFFMCIRAYRNETYHTPFMWSMVCFMIVGFSAQVYMIHSQKLYDAQFDIAHILKIFSCIFPIYGIAIGTLAMYRREEQLTVDLKETTLSIESLDKEVRQRKQAEKEIYDLARFPSENPNPVLRIAKDGKVLYANDAAGGVLKSWNTALTKEVPEKWQRVIEEAFKTGKNMLEEDKIGDQTLSFGISPVLDADYVNLYARDITERKEAENALRALKDALEVKIAERTKELKKKINDLEIFHDATVDRELRMEELRKEIAELKEER